MRATVAVLRDALAHIAGFEDDVMGKVTSLHYDMRGYARASLAADPDEWLRARIEREVEPYRNRVVALELKITDIWHSNQLTGTLAMALELSDEEYAAWLAGAPHESAL